LFTGCERCWRWSLLSSRIYPHAVHYRLPSYPCCSCSWLAAAATAEAATGAETAAESEESGKQVDCSVRKDVPSMHIQQPQQPAAAHSSSRGNRCMRQAELALLLKRCQQLVIQRIVTNSEVATPANARRQVKTCNMLRFCRAT